jgi:hypothetical protein
MNIKDILGDQIKMNKKERQITKQIHTERNIHHDYLRTLSTLYKDKEHKVMNMKQLEKKKSFQKDFNKMKSYLISPQKDLYMSSSKDKFFKSTTDVDGKKKDPFFDLN